MEDAPLSDWDGTNEDLEMVDAEVIEAEWSGGDGGSAPRHSLDPEEVPERIPNHEGFVCTRMCRRFSMFT